MKRHVGMRSPIYGRAAPAVYVYVRAYPPSAQNRALRLVRQVGKADSLVVLDQAASAVGRGKDYSNGSVHSYLLFRSPSLRRLSLGAPSGMTK